MVFFFHSPHVPSLVVPEILLLVEQISPTTAQIDNLRAAIPILLQTCALEAVESIRDSFAAANDALVLVIAERAFVADAGESCWTHIRVADGAFAVALVTETTDRNSGLLAAHNEIGMMTGHGGGGVF